MRGEIGAERRGARRVVGKQGEKGAARLLRCGGRGERRRKRMAFERRPDALIACNQHLRKCHQHLRCVDFSPQERNQITFRTATINIV